MEFYEIHTSDRIAYKRCRRKWSFASPTRMHLTPLDEPDNINLWFGSGIHFALEDYHGYHRFETPMDALFAYYEAFRESELPEGALDMLDVGMGMLENYIHWRQFREEGETVWFQGVPQVEVRFALELTDLSVIVGVPVVYRGTIDRLVVDPDGNYWVQDYKTAKNIDISKLSTDPQISAYLWAAEQYFGFEIQGILYTQLAKQVPERPKELVNGGFSINKTQLTTQRVYREALLEVFPNGKFPDKYIDFLNYLASLETFEGDRFIRTDKVYRNQSIKINTYKHILEEATEMMNPNLSLYPNPTRDCAWDCPFREVCILMEEGGDWEYQLKNFYKVKPEDNEGWRAKIKWPKTKEEKS